MEIHTRLLLCKNFLYKLIRLMKYMDKIAGILFEGISLDSFTCDFVICRTVCCSVVTMTGVLNICEVVKLKFV